MMFRAIKLAAFLAPLLAVLPYATSQIYVSPAGDDTHAGTRLKPIHTLEHARDLARELKQQQQDDVHIWLAGGTYRLQQPLVLTSQDSGSGSANIVYSALPGQRPVVSGGIQIKSWKRVDAARNLWSASVPPDVKNTRQLYVDGVRATRARGRVPVELIDTDSGYTTSDATMAQWKNPTDMEMVYTGGNSIWSEHSEGLGSWDEPRCPVASISTTAITMVQPCWDNSTKRVMLPSGARTANLVGPKSVGKQPTYIENAYELLGTPGQFYFDRPAAMLYYVPRKGENLNTADVELPVLEKLVDGQGTAAAPVHNLVFSGIQFSYATWLGPNGPDGFSEIQAGYQVTGPEGYSRQGLCTLVPGGFCPYGAWTKEAGNIAISYAHDVKFIHDFFVHLGAAGLDLGDGTQHCVVEGSVFTDISGNGVQLGGVDTPLAPEAEFTANDRIDNNLFENIGAEYRGGIGVVVGYARQSSVRHNQFDHTPYATISMGWGGWPDKIKLAGQTNYSGGNVVADNLIHHFMLVLSDGGGIYTQGRTGKTLEDGEKVTGNVVHDQWSSGHGIYTDNGSSMITVGHNVMFHTNHDNWGSRHHDYYDGHDGKDFDPLLIEGNYWQQGDADSSKENVTERGNHLISSLAQVPPTLLQNAGLQPEFRSITRLSFGKASAPEAPSRVAAASGDGFAYVTWSPSVFQGGSPVLSYTVTASTGAHATISAAEMWKLTYVKVQHLTNGKPVTFTVAATNSIGTSPASLPSHAITPSDHKVALPLAPSGVTVHPGEGIVSIHFQSPSVEHGTDEESPIIAYAITVNPGGRKVLFTGRNVIALQEGKHTTFNVVDGLTRGKAYSFSVAAVNAAGEGAAATVGPVTIP